MATYNFDSCEHYGVELSTAPLLVARRRIDEPDSTSRAEFALMDADNLPFTGYSFDLVFSAGVLHHFDLDRALKELSRVLKLTGRAFFLEPLDNPPLVDAFQVLRFWLSTYDEKLLKPAGFSRLSFLFSMKYVRYHYLLSILTPLLNVIYPTLGLWVVPKLKVVDSLLLEQVDWLTRWAWLALLEPGSPIREKSGGLLPKLLWSSLCSRKSTISPDVFTWYG